MVKREKANYLIQSVSHAFDVIEEICKSGKEIGVTDLSKKLKLHKNNTFRLLATLLLRGYVEQNPETENYRLGVKCLQLGQSFIAQSPLVARVYPMLRAFSDSIGETVSFATLHHGYVQFPVTVDSKRAVKVTGRSASSVIAKQTAIGRLLTAQLPDAQLTEILSTNTPHDAAIKNQLTELRASGLIVDKGGIEADVVAVCKIIRNHTGEVVGAIEVLAPQYRAKVETLVASVEDIAAQISTALGYSKSLLTGAIEKEVSTSGAHGTPASPYVNASSAQSRAAR